MLFYAALIPRWTVHAINSAPLKTHLDRLQQHVSQIALTALLTQPSSAASVLTYFHAAASAALTHAPRHALPTPMPAPETYSLLLFSSSPSTLARTCALLAKLKRLLELGRPAAASAAAWDGAARARASDAASLNSFLMDTCNLLWRSRAFSGDAGGGVARGCLVPAATVAGLLGWLPRAAGPPAASPTRCPRPSGCRRTRCSRRSRATPSGGLERRRLPPRAAGPGEGEGPRRLEGPASQRALVALAADGGVSVDWREYRVWVVEWRAERGLGGVRDLVFAAMKDLGGTA